MIPFYSILYYNQKAKNKQTNIKPHKKSLNNLFNRHFQRIETSILDCFGLSVISNQEVTFEFTASTSLHPNGCWKSQLSKV